MTIDYLEFMGRYTRGLKRKGSFYLGWCPFHGKEGFRRRSFVLNPENGLWGCSFCRQAGNTYDFCRLKGLDRKEAPDWDPNYRKYSYPGGGVYYMPHFKALERDGLIPFWTGPREDWDKFPYNLLAVELAGKWKKTLWICRGPKDTDTLHRAGEFAIGIPSNWERGMLAGISLVGIPELIIAMTNDESGKEAAQRLLERFPFGKVVQWPEDKRRGHTITDQRLEKKDLSEQSTDSFVTTLRGYATSSDPLRPLANYLREKWTRDQDRPPSSLLGYGLRKFRSLAKNIDGVQPGLYLVGAETGIGKTAFLCNLALDLLDSNDDLTGLYFSMKESKDKIINFFLGLRTGLGLNLVQRPQQSSEDKRILKSGYDYLFGLTKQMRLFLRDSSEIENFEELVHEIRRRMNRKLFIMMDGLLDYETGDPRTRRKGNPGGPEWLKRSIGIYQAPLFCSADLQNKGTRRNHDFPKLDDFIDDGRLASEADLVLLMYPDEGDEAGAENGLLLNLKYAKNKLSPWRETERIRFDRITGRMEEFPK